MLYLKKAKIALVSLSIFLITAFMSVAQAADPLSFSIHPYLPASKLVEMFTPLVNYIADSTGQPVEIFISKDYREHVDKVGRDESDIAFMGPASYVKMVDLYGKKPLLARLEVNGKPTFQGVIIVQKESTSRSLSDLVGKRFAFGDPESTMSHLVPRYMLYEAGVNIKGLADYAFLKNHENVALGVLVGDFDAGAVKEAVFEKYRSRGLRALTKTPSISEHVFVTRKTLSPETIKLIRKTLLGLKNNEKSRAIMSPIKPGLSGMVKASDSDYNELRMIIKKIKTTGIN